MKFLQSIKKALGKRKINSFLLNQKRKVKVMNYANAKSIAVVYPITTTDYQDVVENYVSFLSGEIGFKKISVLGYYEGKELPNFLPTQSHRSQYFTSKMLDFHLFGKGKEVENFVAEEFDILVDLSNDYSVPIKQIVAFSKAQLKIGRLSEENEKFFDFMVEMPQKSPASKFITQVNNFLTQVNPN